MQMSQRSTANKPSCWQCGFPRKLTFCDRDQQHYCARCWDEFTGSQTSATRAVKRKMSTGSQRGAAKTLTNGGGIYAIPNSKPDGNAQNSGPSKGDSASFDAQNPKGISDANQPFQFRASKADVKMVSGPANSASAPSNGVGNANRDTMTHSTTNANIHSSKPDEHFVKGGNGRKNKANVSRSNKVQVSQRNGEDTCQSVAGSRKLPFKARPISIGNDQTNGNGLIGQTPTSNDTVMKPAPGFKSRTTDTTLQFLTSDQFDDLAIGNASKKALREVMGYKFMTKVQSLTVKDILSGRDVLAKAKTGTGKTLAFLIPTVEQVLLKRQALSHGSACFSIVISPTRELAQQIADEGHALTKFIAGFKIVTVYGGTNMNTDVRNLDMARSGRIDALIATPGRLIDHLENTGGFAEAVSRASVLILDEADRLLEMGFRKEIEKIIAALPRERQSLLFSATIPSTIKSVAGICLKQGYVTIDCVGDEEKQVVDQVRQELVTVPSFEAELPTLFDIITTAMKANPSNYKLIVFFITARQAGFVSEVAKLFFESSQSFCRANVYEIHSRKSQSFRNKSSDSFRKCTTGVMFSSDVSARGLDYPGVTHVIQVASPASREQYIHRLGRTARAGESGQGILVLHPFEKFFLNEIKDLDLQERMVGVESEDGASEVHGVDSAVQRTPVEVRDQCYRAWLGYHNGLLRKLRWSQQELVERANLYARATLKLEQQPTLQRKTVGKMGLKGVRGLAIE